MYDKSFSSKKHRTMIVVRFPKFVLILSRHGTSNLKANFTSDLVNYLK